MELIENNHLLKAKLSIKSVDEFTDEQAESIFMDTEIKSEKDIHELLQYLKQYRPKLFETLEAKSASIQEEKDKKI